jgi:TrpR-related protein YerC/YecD
MVDDNYLNSEDTKDFYQTLLRLETEEECKHFLRDLLTEKEIKEFVNRWKVVRLLDKKMPYEQITENTGMSSTTIARISKWLHEGTGGYRLMLERLKRKRG